MVPWDQHVRVRGVERCARVDARPEGRMRCMILARDPRVPIGPQLPSGREAVTSSRTVLGTSDEPARCSRAGRPSSAYKCYNNSLFCSQPDPYGSWSNTVGGHLVACCLSLSAVDSVWILFVHNCICPGSFRVRTWNIF